MDRIRYAPHSASNVVEAAPVTKVLTLMIPSNVSEEAIEALKHEFHQLSHSSANDANGVKAVTSGWMEFELPHDASPTGKAKVLKCLLAWPSLAAHRAVMATPHFQSAIGKIKARCLIPPIGRIMFHADFSDVRERTKGLSSEQTA